MPPHATIAAILDIHAMIQGLLLHAVEDVPDSRFTEQHAAIVNHPAWTLSHLNAYAASLLALLDDPTMPAAVADAEMKRFGYGTTPLPDPSAYASKRELLDQFKARNARLAALVAEKHAYYFPRPSPEKFHPHAPTIGHIAITLLIAHPPDHLRQLKLWRRAAGFAETT
ncbi:MAG: DinB family protein [Phycisphaerales bacterium]